MKKSYAQDYCYKTCASKLLLLGLLIGINAIISSCNSSTSTPNPKHIYYVDSTQGSDSYPGSQNQPWKTIQKAANNLYAGDTVIVISGNYSERVEITRSGKPENLITLIAEGAVMTKGFTVKADYISISGFEISDTDDHSVSGWGVYVLGNNCIIENNYIHNATRGGILIDNLTSDDGISNNCIIQDNRLYHNSQSGIEVHGRNHLIEGNEIWGTIQYHPKWVNPPSWVDADGIRFFGSGHIFRQNYIHNISIDQEENINPHIDAFQTWDNEDGQVGSDSIFEQNRIVLGKGATGFQIEGGAHNLIIRNNIVNTFRGVLTYENGQPPYTRPSDIFVLNNAFIGDLLYQIEENPAGLLIGDTTNIVIKNNIITEQRGQTIMLYSSMGDVDYNLFYNSDGSSPLWSPSINDVWEINPLFVNPENGNFHLQAESPAIDAGISLEIVIDDFEGILRPQGKNSDIGPYEFIP